jgi:DnaJ domain
MPLSRREACEILGVKPRDGFDVAHKAYRKLAPKYHPDAPGGGHEARFKALNEAHQLFEEEDLLRKENAANLGDDPLGFQAAQALVLTPVVIFLRSVEMSARMWADAVKEWSARYYGDTPETPTSPPQQKAQAFLAAAA